MMPIIGKLIQRSAARVHDWCWVLVFFFLMMHNNMTPNTGEDDMYWALILRGIGLGLLFVPITTLSLSTLSGKNIGEGAAFTGMMRQLGVRVLQSLLHALQSGTSCKFIAH
jgi:DHA2 family multidrug resistance protein